MKQLQRHHAWHGARALSMSILVLAVLFSRLDLNLGVFSLDYPRGQVLSYASSVNHGDLVALTNQQRAANGLGNVTLNSLLNNSAQAKAEHMIALNYWSHVAPDGTQPWFFIINAGYDYQGAGENLAYGFDTSADIIAAWMASASHRANVLGNYVDVGFGIANGANYQGGQYTVVVAHYARPVEVAPPPPPAPTPVPEPQPAPSAPAPQAPVTTPPPATTTPEPAPEAPVAEPVPVAEEPNTEDKDSAATQAQTKNDNDKTTPPSVITTTSTSIPFSQALLRGSIPLVMGISLALVAGSSMMFVMAHRALFRRAIANGEQFIITHPGVDAALVAVASALILTTRIGRI